MANAKPTILIVPGSFSFGKFYDGIIDRLTNAGYTAFASDLPSASRRTPQQPATLADDAAHFHGLAEKLVEAGKEVVLFAHSYGGNPASECAKGLWMEERKKQGKKGGIVRIVYLASPVVKEGEALTDVMGAINVPFIKVDVSASFAQLQVSSRVFSVSRLEVVEMAILARQTNANNRAISCTWILLKAARKRPSRM